MQFTKEDLPKVDTPWSTVGYLTYKRTYSRKLNSQNTAVDAPTEEYPDSVVRVINAARTQLNCGFTPDEEQRLAGYLLGS